MRANSPPKMALSSIEIIDRLGRGSTSHVFLVKSLITKQYFAMKVIDKFKTNYCHKQLQRQLDIHRALKHNNIVNLTSHIQDSQNHYVLTEYCSSGQLSNLVLKKVAQNLLAQIIFQIALGLQYMHNQNISHCDLKLSNILIKDGLVKICDFGYSIKMNENTNQNKKLFGTLIYLAPEILQKKKRVLFKEADVWALGICLLTLILKKQPYENQQGKFNRQIKKKIIRGQHVEVPDYVSDQLKNLVGMILQVDPSKRIKIQEIMVHPFIVKYEAEKNYQKLKNKQKQIDSGFCSEKVPIIGTNLGLQDSYLGQNSYKSDQCDYKAAFDSIQQYLEQEKPEKEEQLQKPWQFKRKNPNQQQQQTQESNSTVQKIAFQQTKAHQNQNDQTIKKKLNYPKPQQTKNQPNRIKSKLIQPFEQFIHKTRNGGYIKIHPTGDLEIVVGKQSFEIKDNGNIMHFKGIVYSFEQIFNSKVLNQMYCYAYDVVEILKKKKYCQYDYGEVKEWNFVFGVEKKKKFVIAEYWKPNQPKILLYYKAGSKSLKQYSNNTSSSINLNSLPQSCQKARQLFFQLIQKHLNQQEIFNIDINNN